MIFGLMLLLFILALSVAGMLYGMFNEQYTLTKVFLLIFIISSAVTIALIIKGTLIIV